MSDVVAGIIVAIIALPLSIALALASGVGPEQGIYTAIAAGFVISFLGGSQVQIAGPTAAFATIVAGIVAKSGVEGLAVATIMAGIILVIMGFCHFGSLIKFIPFTITTGLYFRYRGDDRYRSVEGFLWRNLSGRHGDDRDDAEAESVRSWIRKCQPARDHRRRGVSGDSDCDADDHGKNSGIAGSGYWQVF